VMSSVSATCKGGLSWQLTLLNNNNNKHAYAGQLNSFTHLRALLVLHDRSIVWPRQLAKNSLCFNDILLYGTCTVALHSSLLYRWHLKVEHCIRLLGH
jgi:hypothetical protein